MFIVAHTLPTGPSSFSLNVSLTPTVCTVSSAVAGKARRGFFDSEVVVILAILINCLNGENVDIKIKKKIKQASFI